MAAGSPLPPEEKKIDRRIQRTKHALRKALIDLIDEKGPDEISIEEITQRANLGRATFYLHYKDKEDLLLDEFSEKINEQVRLISEIPASIWNPADAAFMSEGENAHGYPLLLVFEHAAENAVFYRFMLRGAGSKRIAQRINEIVVQSYRDVVETKFLHIPRALFDEIPVELLAVYFSGALLSCLNWWLEQNPAPSPATMTKFFQRLYIPGIKQLLLEQIENR